MSKRKRAQVSAAPPPAADPARLLVPAGVALAAAAVFLPALGNEFHWDDFKNLVDNPGYKGLDAAHLAWMFKGSFGFMGNYEPLHWLTMGIVYELAGMRPLGYHLLALLLHGACAWLVYDIFRILLGAASAEPPPESKLRLCAAAGALLFAVHPLRVEAVAWASGQHYVLAGFFYLLSIRAYLQALRGPRPLAARALSVGAFALSLLSLPIGMTLPLALLVLDAYPLRRRAYAEKIPYFAVAGLGALAGMGARRTAGTVMPLGYHGIADRVAQSFWGLAFYVRHTVAPRHLLPYYQFPPKMNPLALPFTASAAAVLAFTVLLIRLRKRHPEGLAAWAFYVATVLPVIGLTQTGLQMAADRYTYLCCLSWAALAAGGLLALPERFFKPALGAAAAILAAFAVLTLRYEKVWRNSESVWRYSLAIDPENATSENNLGNALFKKGEKAQALEHYRAALRIKPRDANAHFNLAVALVDQGKEDEAAENYLDALASDPRLHEAYSNMGDLLARRGRYDEAAADYRKALAIRPGMSDVELALGRALDKAGKSAEALQAFRQAAADAPGDFDSRQSLALAYARRGDLERAIPEFEASVKLKPAEPLARQNWGAALAMHERLDDAVAQYRAAIALQPNYPDAHANLAIALSHQRKWAQAEAEFQAAIAQSPGNESYRRNYEQMLKLRGRP